MHTGAVWGPMIAWYLFLAGASAGAFLTSALVGRVYPDAVKTRRAARIAAPVLMAIGLIVLVLDAEAGFRNPMRLFHLIANPASVMTLGVYSICLYMPVCCVVALLEILRKGVPRWLTWVGVVGSLCVATYTGFLLGVISAYPLWNNALLPVLFVISALSAGASIVGLCGLTFEHDALASMHLLKRGHIVLAIAEIVVLATMLAIVASGSPEGASSAGLIVVGRYAPLFWGGLVLLGLVIPLLIEGAHLLGRAQPQRVGPSGVALGVVSEGGVLVGSFVLRLLVVLAALPVAFL